eukprot:TRINITY_DN904_c0_g1_i1.p1 TRINITY_DN904_c0_g1~~TRINITY_DN904_c0_g1_i1.p1  ORF type:complete len:357 (-),score=104.76 TRINITY_DN904_c0_g1_i1:78-1148(-)
MSRVGRVGKVVAVAAVVGSVAWVGHQVVRHHHKAGRLHAEIAQFVGEVHERHHENNVAQDFASDFKHEDGRREWRHPSPGGDDSDSLAEGGDDWRFDGRKHEDWGRRWRRHHQRDHEEEQQSDSGDEHDDVRRGRRHRRHSSHDGSSGKAVQGSTTDDHERQTWADARQKWHESVKAQTDGLEVTDVESAVVTSVNLARNGDVWEQTQAQSTPEQEQAAVGDVPELEDNHEEDSQEQQTGDEAPQDDSDFGRAGSRRHHGHRFRDEEHYREFENSLTEEERAEFRRLRKEARRLHCDAARTAGGFVAGAAFVGGVAHLRRLRRERREAAASAAGGGASCGGHCAGESNAIPSVTNA